MQYTDVVLKNEDGSDAVENGKPQMALFGIKHALITDAGTLDPAKKLARFELFTKLSSASPRVELSVDEVALAKEAANVYPTLVYGQLVAFLNQK